MTDSGQAARPPAGPGRAGPGMGGSLPRGRAVAYSLAILSLATAVIHFAVTGEHFAEYWAFGLFMLVVAWLQLAWAIVAVVIPARLLLWGGIVLNAGVVAVYIITRTVGDVIGPAPHEVEPLGFGDGLCTVLEALVVAGCGWLLFARADQQQKPSLTLAPVLTGGVTAVLLSVALVAGGPEMVMGSDSAAAAAPAPAVAQSGSHMAGMGGSGAGGGASALSPAAAAIRLPTRSPAGDITLPDPGAQMAPGMKMASSRACTATPAASQQHAAVSLVNASWAGARKYQSLAAAKAAGYRPITPPGAPVVHYLSPAAYEHTLTGGPVLDTARPPSLVYANTPNGAVLAAAMYITTPGGATPQPGGCLTQWHVHTNLCFSRGLGVVGALTKAHPSCPAGSRNRVTPAMLHVWFVPIPGGPTAVDAPDRQVVRAAERVRAPKNGPA
ncbi:MAG TPA: hypothetical protein VFV41_07985 [Streptosporangiaceae bacterium]|nr:hypothetical protein [Streptosporangiaceae bacterium]